MERYKIMCVDDDHYYLSAIYRVLHIVFDMTIIPDPFQAMQAFVSQGPFDVIVADYKMSGMDGLEMLNKMRQISDQPKRIILTGYADLEIAMRAVNDGRVSGFLTKPIPHSDLKRHIEDIMQSDMKTTINPPRLLQRKGPDSTATCSFILLSMREKEIVDLVGRGLSNAEISKTLNITIGTVKSHLKNIFCKMNVNSRTKLIALQNHK